MKTFLKWVIIILTLPFAWPWWLFFGAVIVICAVFDDDEPAKPIAWERPPRQDD